MNLKYTSVLSSVPDMGGNTKRKTEIAFSMALARRLPIPDARVNVLDRILFERTAQGFSTMERIAELNEHIGVDAEFIMKFTCDLWCARVRVAYPKATAYVTDVYSGSDLFDRVFNYSQFISKDSMDVFNESADAIVSLSNGFAAMM